MTNPTSTTFSSTDGAAIIGEIQNILDAAGNPTSVPFTAPPVWTSSDSTIFVPAVSADGLSCSGTILKTGTVTVTTVGGGYTFTSVITAVAGTPVSFTVIWGPAPPPPPPAA